MLHHLLLYGCKYDSSDPKNAAFKYQNNGAIDGESQLGNSAEGCKELFYAWALGGNPLILPKDVGFSIGEDIDAVWTHFVLQFHYHNQNLE